MAVQASADRSHLGYRAPTAADPVVWPGCVYAWLCTSAAVEGLAQQQGPAGPPARLGNRPIPVNGCPQRIGERITYSRPVADCTQPGGREIRTDADSTPLTGLSRAREDQPRNGLKPECRLVVRASMSQGLCRSMSAQECLSSASGSWWWGPWSAMGWARELGWSLGWERGLGWWSSGWESLSSSSRAWAPVSAVWGSC
jgi:hypothetical protein